MGLGLSRNEHDRLTRLGWSSLDLEKGDKNQASFFLLPLLWGNRSSIVAQCTFMEGFMEGGCFVHLQL